jgi:Tol biopolymer transport system component
MGAVYRARDTRLDRTVAIKVLLAHAAADQEFRERFDREARAVSALNHPHICALYDVGQAKPSPGDETAAAVDFLVMELVEGETLADRIARGALPIAEVLTVGAQIAQALDSAHRRGIIHRDLKPGNVMLTKSGVKLLDFGLAKVTGVGLASSHPAAATAFASQPMTAKGTILGTLQYMAPEQLHGQDADHRADIFALGAILYEMVTGKRAFEGATSATVISAIVEKEPAPLSSVQPMTPPTLARLIRACLTKDPGDRLQNAYDVLLQLRWIAEGGSDAGIAAPVAARRRFRVRAATIAAAVFGLSTVVLGAMLLLRESPPPEPLRFTVASPEGTAFAPSGNAGNGFGHQFALSPDGTRIAFVAAAAGQEPRLWVRRFDQVESTPLAGTDGAKNPFWSPDSLNIGYVVRDSRLDRIGANGGPSVTICRVPGMWTASWGADSTILVATAARQGVMKVSAKGGTLTPVTTLDTAARDIFHAQPEFLPDGRFLYSVNAYGNAERTGLYLSRPDGSGNTRILPGVFSPVAYLPSGHLLFVRAGVLMSVGFDLARGVVLGEPVAVTPETGGEPRRLFFSISRDGSLAFASAPEPRSQLVWYDRSGTRGQPLGPAARGVRDPEISPDRRSAALSYVDVEMGIQNIFIADLQRGVFSRLTTGWAISPLWSPDSTRVAFAAVPTGTLDVVVQSIGGKDASIGGKDADRALVTSPDWNLPAAWTRTASSSTKR